jgi:hypothetical protein
MIAAGGALSDLSAPLILLALRRYQNEALRNNSPLWALAMKSHKIVNTATATRNERQAFATNQAGRNALPRRPAQIHEGKIFLAEALVAGTRKRRMARG